MADTPSRVAVRFTVGVRGPSGEWTEVGTVDVPVNVALRPVVAPPLLDVPEQAVFDPPAKRCADCGRLLRPVVDAVVATERGLTHVQCPI